MLAVSPLRDIKDERQSEMESFSIGGDDFLDFSGGNLLDSIDFDDFFVGINDGDVLPDLEMDNEILAEFSLSGGEESSEIMNTSLLSSVDNKVEKIITSGSDGSSGLSSNHSNQGEDVMSKSNEFCVGMSVNSSSKRGDKVKKSSSNQSKNAQGKRKVKVDWTPELHRRFVQAVEQLGVDKAVPSRILELMGIDCLTRHNIASHLQKYRSHRKHLLAREAEAANWNQRGQMYAGPAPVAPTIGFPRVAPMPPHFRPLHVWGHPSVDQSLMHVWPKHVAPPPAHPPPPPSTWPPHPPHPHPDPSFWHSHHQRAPSSLTPGTPCFPPPMAAARYPALPVPCVPLPNMYKVDPSIGVPTPQVGQNIPKPPTDFQPSKESIDAAIGDVLSKPWLPLPLGLKQPSVDCVLMELQRQGISKIPPTTT